MNLGYLKKLTAQYVQGTKLQFSAIRRMANGEDPEQVCAELFEEDNMVEEEQKHRSLSYRSGSNKESATASELLRFHNR